MATRVVNRSTGAAYDVYVGAPTIFANPYVIGIHGSREQVIAAFERYVRAKPGLMASIKKLRGLTIACSCKPLPCHADVIAKIAEEEMQWTS